MKWLLALSLLGNLIVGVLYVQKSSEPPLERIVLEEKVVTRVQETPTAPVTLIGVAEVKTVMPPSTPTPEAVEKEQESVSQDRQQYLTTTLGMTPEKMEQIEEIKDRHAKKFQAILGLNSNREPSLEQRQELLKVESQREQELIRVVGKTRWEKFKTFRAQYNQKKFTEAQGLGVVVPLDI